MVVVEDGILVGFEGRDRHIVRLDDLLRAQHVFFGAELVLRRKRCDLRQNCALHL